MKAKLFASVFLIFAMTGMVLAETVTFDSLTTGSSVKGMGTVATGLDIQSDGNAIVLEELDDVSTYGAPNGPDSIKNGCLVGGKGFADIDRTYSYRFEFDGLADSFSIDMFDFGDWNPNSLTDHAVSLIAYDGADVELVRDELVYTTAAVTLPHSSTPDYGDLYYTGDACDAEYGEPGYRGFSVAAPGIAYVVLELSSQDDPNFAFDNIEFNLDTDGDGVSDGDDNCPVDANADQSDIDTDGFGDVCDLTNSVYAAITSPDAYAVFFTSVSLEAYFEDTNHNDHTVQWAVRPESCGQGTNVWANVGNRDDPYTWLHDGDYTTYFASTADVSAWDPTWYCFIFNPKEGGQETDLRETREFWVGDFTTADSLVAYNPVGTEHTVTVDISVPVADFPVLFSVEGVASEAETVVTDANGMASYTYLNDGTPGTDTIVACADENLNEECDEGEPMLTFTKYWLEHYVTGGGFIETVQEIPRGKNLVTEAIARISMGGNVGYALDGSLVGNWQVNFHETSENWLDKGKFHATEITELVFADRPECGEAAPPEADYNIAKYRANGRFNGEDGWSIWIRMSDQGEPGKDNDAVRVTLWNPAGQKVYDTLDSGDFAATDGSPGDCPNSGKTNLGGGNFQIHPPAVPELV